MTTQRLRPARSALLVVAGLVATALVAALPVGVGEAARTTTLPERLANVGDSRQVVVVTAAHWDTSYARLQAWQQDAKGTWTRVLDPVDARLGWSGFQRAANRLQGSGKTPAGTFRLLRGFGLDEPPAATKLRYRVLDRNDWWPYDPQDPKTYNVFQTKRASTAKWRTSWAEDLDSYTRQYRYAVVLDYNLPSGITRTKSGERVASQTADTRKGGGIFLHVNGRGATAGCVSVTRADMRRLVRWLDPAMRPIAVMGPRDVIDRM